MPPPVVREPSLPPRTPSMKEMEKRHSSFLETRSSGGSAAVQRECQDTEQGYYSPSGDNEQYACNEGVSFASAPGLSSCELCASCGAGEREATPCTATADRTCAAVDPGYYSPNGDIEQATGA